MIGPQWNMTSKLDTSPMEKNALCLSFIFWQNYLIQSCHHDNRLIENVRDINFWNWYPWSSNIKTRTFVSRTKERFKEVYDGIEPQAKSHKEFFSLGVHSTLLKSTSSLINLLSGVDTWYFSTIGFQWDLCRIHKTTSEMQARVMMSFVSCGFFMAFFLIITLPNQVGNFNFSCFKSHRFKLMASHCALRHGAASALKAWRPRQNVCRETN